MIPARRRGQITGLLALAGLALGACAATGPAAEPGRMPEQRADARETHLSRGSRLLASNEPALAMRAFNTSLGLEGITPEALTGAGMAAQRQGMLGTARNYLEDARDLAPNSPTVHGNLGVVLLALRDYHGARTAFRSALMLSGGEEEAEGADMLRRLLRRAETEIAAADMERRADPAATQRVVRLGTDMFRLAPKADDGAEDGAEDGAASEHGTGVAMAAGIAEASGGEPATEQRTTEASSESGRVAEPSRTETGTGPESPAETETAALAGDTNGIEAD